MSATRPLAVRLQAVLRLMAWQLRARIGLQRASQWLAASLGTVALILLVGHLEMRVALYAFSGVLAVSLPMWPLQALWEQNRPREARLLPGHVPALRAATGLTALLVWSFWAVTVAVCFGLGPWRMLGLLLGLVFLAWTLRRPRLWWWVALLPSLALCLILLASRGPAGAFMREHWLAWGEAWVQGPGRWLALGLGLVALWRWTGCGDAAHQRDGRTWANLKAGLRRKQEGRPQQPVRRQRSEVLRAFFVWPREWIFERALRRGPVARIDHLLSRQAHWSIQLLVGVLLALLFLLLALLMPGKDVLWGDSLLGLWIGVFSLAFAAELGRARALWGLRREQALLALLPGLPTEPGRLARALAGRWLRRGLLAWLLVLGLMLAVLPWTSAKPRLIMGMALAAALLVLPQFSLVDWARVDQARALGWRSRVAPMLGCLLVWLARDQTWSFFAPMLPALGVALVDAGLRWHKLAQAPMPLPVGRRA